jgi:hypothetical protein
LNRHTEPLMRILNTYPPGPGMVMALETYCATVESRARDQGREEVRGDIAATVCQGLHASPPRGLVCEACHNAEVMAPINAQMMTELEEARDRSK